MEEVVEVEVGVVDSGAGAGAGRGEVSGASEPWEVSEEVVVGEADLDDPRCLRLPFLEVIPLCHGRIHARRFRDLHFLLQIHAHRFQDLHFIPILIRLFRDLPFHFQDLHLFRGQDHFSQDLILDPRFTPRTRRTCFRRSLTTNHQESCTSLRAQASHVQLRGNP